ncbi:GDSL-motif lipase 3 [Arabidopsis thaliana]|uniref:GDSL esterase/lipase 3 n=1 Tax=Arabidopsis thaliana TaxID=3702 RepID=GLIP3_ARATH|nr:GDSL-motif lipase 3 [Arabidopsis thaliana]Q9SYF5.2 RecName: Full=GDSL esterase/lipase 3; AltName: Full=Extracellular lipase 3; Flags: Precursor [Arabidopsis thaliana]AEE33032.1 GDSL-motif lipase 3 [Arabidopsis thaliana]|eukprot:NP_175801.1 GDSL-motif lipase 3 [Arabidopsis thaliana]
MVRLVLIIFFVYTIILSIGSINCIDNNNLVTNQAALFVFGDSLFDAGNNNYINTVSSFRSNIWPYGQTNFKFPTGRLSDGPEKAWLPSIPPNLQPNNGNNQFTYGVSFASAGAGALAESFLGMVINLGTQLNNFKDVEKSLRSELGDAETKRVFSRAVYLFHIGANDYFYPFSANSSTFKSNSKEKFVDFVIGNITFVIEEVYKMGGRKFGFLNVGPYECSPNSLIRDRTKIGSCFKPVAELIDMHNKKFPDVLRRLQRQLSGFRYALHDYHTSLSERINSPSKYGFKEGKKACCGSGPLRGINTCGNRIGPSQGYGLCENVTDYLFYDSSHLTEKAHRQIAELIWNGPPNVTRPYNLKALFELRLT